MVVNKCPLHLSLKLETKLQLENTVRRTISSFISKLFMCCLIKASGYTSGDDALDDRETGEEMAKRMQERKHGTAQVGCAGSDGLGKVC